MNTQNINLSAQSYQEACAALLEHRAEIDQSGDIILELMDGTRVLVILRRGIYLMQDLNSLI